MSLALTVLLRAKLNDSVWIVIAARWPFGGSRLGAAWFGSDLGVFVGALTVGVASRFYARWLDRPATITQVPGILLLVPGSVGFRGLAALLDKQVISGIDTTFKMILTAVALGCRDIDRKYRSATAARDLTKHQRSFTNG
jgi:uncharacterized membrane protein YjjB (DUF3815 family)